MYFNIILGISSLSFQEKKIEELNFGWNILCKWILLYLVFRGKESQRWGAKYRCNKTEGKALVR